ncbi:hypothetical protein [Weissella paramesenteroides]
MSRILNQDTSFSVSEATEKRVCRLLINYSINYQT